MIEDEIESIKNDWATGAFTAESVEGTVQLNNEAIGRIHGLFFALEYLVEDFMAEEEDEDEG